MIAIPAMNNERLDCLLKERLDKVKGEAGMWRAEIGARNLMILTDENANRLRIMTPIRNLDASEGKLCLTLLSANFDRALDAKYAVNGGVLWALFVHPLRTFSEDDLENAIKQVYTLAENTGTSYSSGGLRFTGGDEPEPDEEA